MAADVRALAEVWLDCLFPPRCLSPGCSRRGAWICAPCLAGAPALPKRRCAICGDAVLAARADARSASPRCRRCLAQPPAFDLAVAPWLHAPPVTDWIHALKYDRRRRVADLAGQCAAAVVRPHLGPDLARTVVVPVPTHAERRAERGIDVPARLAAVVAASLGVPVAVDALERVRATPPQVGTSRAERLANVLGAIEARRPVCLEHAVVVDDVLTTGATGEACARALKAAGAKRVVVVTLARATHGGDA
ncbi:MAG: ComF family protein [Ardenticatenales bacterium]|nr:ComF family protein [Ardenticatenales bacterium]